MSLTATAGAAPDLHSMLDRLDPALYRLGPDVPARHAQDALRLEATLPPALLLPRTTAELAEIMRHCRTSGIRIVVQGGLCC